MTLHMRDSTNVTYHFFASSISKNVGDTSLGEVNLSHARITRR